jgi:hypothetical protein
MRLRSIHEAVPTRMLGMAGQLSRTVCPPWVYQFKELLEWL